MDSGHDDVILNLKRIAKSRRWSMNRLADAAGVSRSALSDILSKRQSPTPTTLQRLADALEVPLGVNCRPTSRRAITRSQRLDVRDSP